MMESRCTPPDTTQHWRGGLSISIFLVDRNGLISRLDALVSRGVQFLVCHALDTTQAVYPALRNVSNLLRRFVGCVLDYPPHGLSHFLSGLDELHGADDRTGFFACGCCGLSRSKLALCLLPPFATLLVIRHFHFSLAEFALCAVVRCAPSVSIACFVKFALKLGFAFTASRKSAFPEFRTFFSRSTNWRRLSAGGGSSTKVCRVCADGGGPLL